MALLLVAVMAGAFHLFPFWHAQAATPADRQFTGNLSRSPDYMQYRVWMRQTQDAGPIVPNKFTLEANTPHLPVFFYYGIGQIAHLTGIQPEYVYEYAGAALAFAFVLLLFFVVRLFLPRNYAAWWVFLAILLGGGLTAHLKIAAGFQPIAQSPLQRLIGPVNHSLTFDALRFSYVYKVLLDTHFLMVYLSTTLAMLSLYWALARRSARYIVLAAVLCSATTLIHVYEGVLIVSVIVAVSGVLFLKGDASLKRGLLVAGVCGGVTLATMGVVFCLQRASGLPITRWRAPDVLFSNVLLGYPIGWAAFGLGFVEYWKTADLKRLFIIGWILGCTLVLLSSPYYPFADRGTTTLQIPLYIAAGVILFGRVPRVRAWMVVLLIGALGPGAVRMVRAKWVATAYSAERQFMFMDSEHRRTVEVLRTVASTDDVLLADYFDYRWLFPEFPGRGFHPHYFLTADFEGKREEADQFFGQADAVERAEFLADQGVRFVWVNRENRPLGVERTPGLIPLHKGSHGTLFEFVPGGAVGKDELEQELDL